MKLGIVKRILKDDLAKTGDIPAWIDTFLQPLNDFIEKVGLALQNRLTFADNFLCKPITQTFTSGAEYQLNPALKSGPNVFKVIGVILMDSGGGTVDKFRWNRKSSGSIGVTITFSDVTSAVCTVYVFLGQ